MSWTLKDLLLKGARGKYSPRTGPRLRPPPDATPGTPTSQRGTGTTSRGYGCPERSRTPSWCHSSSPMVASDDATLPAPRADSMARPVRRNGDRPMSARTVREAGGVPITADVFPMTHLPPRGEKNSRPVHTANGVAGGQGEDIGSVRDPSPRVRR